MSGGLITGLLLAFMIGGFITACSSFYVCLVIAGVVAMTLYWFDREV